MLGVCVCGSESECVSKSVISNNPENDKNWCYEDNHSGMAQIPQQCDSEGNEL